jgi:hypothetical protein
MTRALLARFATFIICTSPVPCVAQVLAPVIYLSTAESAKTRQAAEDLKRAQDRDGKATAAWQDFYGAYQRAHPEMPSVRFASDFRVAFARKVTGNANPLTFEATTVELSTQERQNATSLHREMEEAKAALLQAQKKWSDNWHQLVFGHFPNSDGSGLPVQLPDGKSAVIPAPWANNGVMFTPDFRVCVPGY